MTQEELKQQLLDKFGIYADNCYPKKSYLRNNIPTIGLFSREIDSCFYFYNEYNQKFYKLPIQEDKKEFEIEEFMGKQKYQVPLSICIELKETKEYELQDDEHFNTLTVRDLYAIIQNKPVSNKEWLNKVILNK